MKIEPNAKCECGQELPWHLFKLQLGMEHVCSCERLYKETDGVVALAGTAVNPFARHDKENPA